MVICIDRHQTAHLWNLTHLPADLEKNTKEMVLWQSSSSALGAVEETYETEPSHFPKGCSFCFFCSRSTIFLRLHTNGYQELQYLPGDHLGVFPGNHEDLVNALIERLEDAPPTNQLVKVELLEERSTALGNKGQKEGLAAARMSSTLTLLSVLGHIHPFHWCALKSTAGLIAVVVDFSP